MSPRSEGPLKLGGSPGLSQPVRNDGIADQPALLIEWRSNSGALGRRLAREEAVRLGRPNRPQMKPCSFEMKLRASGLFTASPENPIPLDPHATFAQIHSHGTGTLGVG